MIIVISVTFLLSLLSLLVFRSLAMKFGLVDRPNDRSQHVTPTLVGAGVAFASALCAVLYVLDPPLLSGWLGARGFVVLAMLLVGVGLFDDKYQLSSGIRIVIYMLAAALVVASLPALSWWWYAVGVTALVWVINLVNFMDGLDGFVATQAMSVAVGLALLVFFSSVSAPGLALTVLLLAAALVPFLLFNWPPASMFMGDAGAVFIGLYLGVVGFEAAMIDWRLGWAWLILMMPFLIDATGTLLLRLLKGYAPHLAHRDHAYQRIAQRLQSPLIINLGLLALQGLWQFPLAWLALGGGYSTLIAVILSAIPSALILVYARRTA